MIRIHKQITSNIAAAFDEDQPVASMGEPIMDETDSEIVIQQRICHNIYHALSELISQAREIDLFKKKGNEYEFLDKIVNGFVDFDAPPIAELMEQIERDISIILGVLNHNNINPSMDTIEFAVSRLNFDIFYRCVLGFNEFNSFYVTLQRNNNDLFPYITTLHINDDLSSLIYLYENIHNIAYNIIYNHEYFLPFDCKDVFETMITYLKAETSINILVEDGSSPQRSVMNPADELTEYGNSMGDTDIEDSSVSSFSPPPLHLPGLPRAVGPVIVPKSPTFFPTGTSLRHRDGRYGGSSRTRRPRKKQKQTKRTRGRLRRSHRRKRTCKKSNK
jgi:hypothetical protein